MKVLRTAVIGLGRIGWAFHVPQAAKHDGFDLVAVVDPLQERLDEAKSEYGVKGYNEYTKLLDALLLPFVILARIFYPILAPSLEVIAWKCTE